MTTNGANVKSALDAAIDAAWARYHDQGTRYTEGFADGLEAAMRILERAERDSD